MTEDDLRDPTIDSRLTKLEIGFKNVTDLLVKLDGKIDNIQIGRRPNLSAIAAVAAVLVTVIATSGGVAWTIINSNIAGAVRQPNDDITHLTDNLRSLADSYSKQWDRLGKIEKTIADGQAERRAEQASLEQREAEFETQFRANDALNNMTRMWQNRINAMVWERTFPGSRWPGDSYYPEIGQNESETRSSGEIGH
jgi:hypothetical protein